MGDKPYIAEQWAGWASGLDAQSIPLPVSDVVARLFLDICGLCVAARKTDYVAAIVESCDSQGQCTLIGHNRTLDRFDAALLNGTAAHGEDFDDTFEGTPVHVGAVIIPTVLATLESTPSRQYSGSDLLKAVALGGELCCRMALVTPMAMHRAGFHPTAVIGTLGAALAVSSLLRLDKERTTCALGLAGSMASGIIEYLAEGTWSKRLHGGWAAQSGLRAALLARSGFVGPRSVFEGRHGFFHAFTNGDTEPDYSYLTDNLGQQWLLDKLAFKPYPCGTMVQPFIDCALKVHQQNIGPEHISAINCSVGEGTVHRLWEPLAEKRAPSSPYSAKFSVPYGIAVAIIDGKAGLAQYEQDRVQDAQVRALAQRISYTIDPANEYPRNYSGHLAIDLVDGKRLEFHQPHLRGGAHQRLDDDELRAKFHANTTHGGWNTDKIQHSHQQLAALLQQDSLGDFSFLRG